MDRRPDRQLEFFRKLTAQQKLDLAARLRQMNLDLVEAGLRSKHGSLSKEDFRLLVLQRILPARLFSKVYGTHER